MTEQKVSTRYARALLETAKNEGLVDEVLKDFITINNVMKKSKELQALMLSPVVQNWKKKKIISEIFESHIGKLTFNFILLLAEKRRERLIKSISIQYEIQYNELNNKLPVVINSAKEIDETIKEKIIAKLTKMTNKEIIPTYKIVPALKGGIMVKIDDWVYDASVRNQLEMLFKSLSEGQLN